MKKVLSILLIAASLTIMLTGCAKTLSGSYTSSNDLFGIAAGSVTYTFKGNTVTLSVNASVLGFSKDSSYEGTYQITEDENDGQHITLTFTDEAVNSYSGTFDFAEGKTEDGVKTISIGGSTYTLSQD